MSALPMPATGHGLGRWIVALLTGALLLAVGTPVYLSSVRPGVGPYLLNPWVLVPQALPFLFAAVLWVPRWRWGRERAWVSLASLMLVAALVIYVPVIRAPERWGGDMIGLTAFAVSAATMGFVLIGSGLVAAYSWWEGRAGRGGGSGTMMG